VDYLRNQKILGDNYDLARVYYQIDGKGKWEHGNNILLREQSAADIARQFKMTTTELALQIDTIDKKLLEVRSKANTARVRMIISNRMECSDYSRTMPSI